MSRTACARGATATTIMSGKGARGGRSRSGRWSNGVSTTQGRGRATANTRDRGIGVNNAVSSRGARFSVM